MPNAAELLRDGKTKELWQKYCGFINLSIEQFMTIQRQLLLEQLELLKKCELGSKVMRGAKPSTIEEFRQQVPLTTYADYAPYLTEKRQDVLPEKPILWMRCTGNYGKYRVKWVPVTQRVYQEAGGLVFTAAVFASCKKRGDIALKDHDKLLHALAPPPYATGLMAHMVDDVFRFALLPHPDLAKKMTFEEKIQQGLELALSDGLDLLGALNSVLVKVGEQFSQEINNNGNTLSLLSKPKTLPRLGKGWLKSKLGRRPILPKDVWALKGIVGGGTDSSIYREKVREMWGRYPLEIYGCTENIILAMQTWDYQAMTFVPHLSFLEFIPADEYHRWAMDTTYQPSTILLDEVKPGQSYALVITNFHGGAFIRYVIGDMIKIASLRNEKLNIDIPQMVFDRRADGLIDIAGFARLTERTIRKAIENSEVAYEDWVVRKEAKEKPVLSLYLELKNGDKRDEDQLAATIHEQLRKLDSDYADLESMIGLKPLKVTLLPEGAFQEYISRQRAAGADLAHLKPPHVNPSDGIIDTLLNCVNSK